MPRQSDNSCQSGYRMRPKSPLAFSAGFGKICNHPRGTTSISASKKTKGSERVLAALLGSYPPPGTRQTETLLVERVEGQDARFGVGAHAGRVDANHCIFLSAESANARLVNRERNRLRRITYVDATHNRAGTRGERVAALAAARRVTVVGEHGVNQASCGGAGNASRAQRAAQVGEGRSITDRRISRLVSDFASGDGTHRSDSRRLVGRHTGAE